MKWDTPPPMGPDSIDMEAGMWVIAAVLVIACVFAGIERVIELWGNRDE